MDIISLIKLCGLLWDNRKDVFQVVRIKGKRMAKIGLAVFFILIVVFAVTFPLCGGTRENIPPIYTEYSPAAECEDVIMTADRISEHILCVTIENKSEGTVYTDYFFELYTPEGEHIPISDDLISGVAQTESVPVFVHNTPPHNSHRMSVVLSLLYGDLKPGTYKIVKQISSNPQYRETNNGIEYISASFDLDMPMRACDYPAEPCDDFIYYDGIPAPEGLTTVITDVSSTGCTVSVENTGDTPWKPGAFALYKIIDGEYMPVRHKSSWGYSLLGYANLESGETMEHRVEWEQIYGTLEVGTYAYVKKWINNDGGESIETMLATEFEVL